MRLSRTVLPLLAGLGLAACEPESESSPVTPQPSVVPLAPTDHLVRASLALRGVRPSLEELRAVDADPAALPGIVDGYLDSPAFGRTIRDLHNEALLLRPDWLYYPAGFPNVGALADRDFVSINGSVMESPLRLIEHVVLEDRPYTEILTADYVMADPITARVWNLPYDDAGPEWQETHYRDKRGVGGILADSWLYVRYQSTPSNANRQRANAVSRALLCYDFLSRDVQLDTSVDVSDPNAVQSAVVENPACASCHQALDPMASFFKDIYPIVVPSDVTAYPATNLYYPGVFEDVLQIQMREPAFFGRPGKTLADLGQAISEDPRFSLCAAKRFYAYFNQVDLDAVPQERAAELQSVLVDSGFDAKALARAVVLGDDFKASRSDDEEQAETLNGMRKIRPDELASLIEDLTGFVWTTDLGALTEGAIGRVELPRDSMLGYRVIGGGIDSAYVTHDTLTDNVASSLFLRAFAEEAASFVVEQDFARAAGDRRLLREVELDTRDEPALRAQLVTLHGRVFGELAAPDSEEVSASLALFEDALASSGDPERAWKTVLVAMLQDVRLSYD